MKTNSNIASGAAILAGLALGLATGAGLASPAHAQVVRLGAPTSAIASATAVPAGYRTLYVSGQTPTPVKPGPPAEFGDTKTQTLSVLGKIRDILVSQGMDMGDVVMMRDYLVGDPAKGGQMDFAGMMEAYKTFFGTAAQPNKPARVTVQVAALVAPGMLSEIEVQAAKAP
jgi:enamine deaminase RidA (YjgF/YER057c/UK114 family)